MKQRFLNQKLGKRTSRRQQLMKARTRTGKPGPAFNPPRPK
jgi:hypothetical protein